MRWFQVLDSREVYPDSDSRSAFSRRKIYRLYVLGACLFVLGWRRCLVSSASDLVLAIYRCISDIRREGEECAGPLVICNVYATKHPAL